MKLLIEIGDPEVKHWPAPFHGIGPKLRAWFQDERTGAKIELPRVQKLEMPYGLRPSWCVGYYRIVFEGGEFTASEDDTEIVGPVTLEGKKSAAPARLL